MPEAPETAKRPPFNADPSPADAFKSAAARLAEIRSYASYYLSAKVDGYLSSAKSAALFGVLGILAGVVGIAILATAGVLIVVGISEGLTLLFGGRMWLADLVTGVVLLSAILGTTYLVVAKLIGKSRAAAKAKYEALCGNK